MAWDNNAETLLGEELTNILDSTIKNFLEQVSDELEGKEHTRESAEVTISLNKEELEKIAAFAELDGTYSDCSHRHQR